VPPVFVVVAVVVNIVVVFMGRCVSFFVVACGESQVSVDRTAPGHVRKQPSSALASALASQGHRASGTAAALAFATTTTKREAEAAVSALVQQVHAKRGNHHPALQPPRDTARGGSSASPAAATVGPSGVPLTPQQLDDLRTYRAAARMGSGDRAFGDTPAARPEASSGSLGAVEGPSAGHIPIAEKRRIRGGLSRLHMERYPSLQLHLQDTHHD
jgi:hypothetical protein